MRSGFIFPLSLLLFLLIGCKKNVGADPEDPEPPVDIIESGLISFKPAFPSEDSELTLIFDAKKGNEALQGHTGDIYAHIGVLTTRSADAKDWKYVKTEWGENTSANRLTQVSPGIYQLKIPQPRQYFGVPAEEAITHLVMVFRNADGSAVARNEDDSEIYVPIYDQEGPYVRFASPEMQPTYSPKPVQQRWQVGQPIQLAVVASEQVDLLIAVNEQPIAEKQSANSLSETYTFLQPGTYDFHVTASNNGRGASQTFSLFVSDEVDIAPLPAGVETDGVTALNGGTTAVFVLTAPEKGFVNLIGDFSDWQLSVEGQMKKTPDGRKWWTQIDNLDPDRHHLYQYVVDGVLRIADPYGELVLDPQHDPYIKPGTFPNLPAYPTGKTTGIVSAVRTNPDQYLWSKSNFIRPHKHDLVIYELLLRDFLDANNYQTLTDTLNYLSNLGVNALQLLPVNEFEGNSSWGYNPSFYFAPDKYYGTKNHLKRLIDECHSRGIAVILDVVLNHSFGQSPMVQMYFENGKPTPNNPWFNPDPTHPFNVGYDFNHESPLTREFVKDVIRFWMTEYRVDGFRFDLSKGFTQKNSGEDVGAWSAYDASRVSIWKEYNNFMRQLDPNFFVILEHFADDQEERELSNEGMMLWNNLNHVFNEASMGWLDNSNFHRLFHTEHGFDQPNLVSYMESHDEERIMYKTLKYGNSAGSYDTKDLNTALKRAELAAAFLFAAPGPKMIWQFGELGYDISIEENGRTGEKPILWEYNTGKRRQLYGAFSRFIRFKTKNEIFRNGQYRFDVAGAIKYIVLSKEGQQVVVVGNFDVVERTANIPQLEAGLWHDNINNTSENLPAGYGKTLAPGAYHIYSRTKLNK